MKAGSDDNTTTRDIHYAFLYICLQLFSLSSSFSFFLWLIDSHFSFQLSWEYWIFLKSLFWPSLIQKFFEIKNRTRKKESFFEKEIKKNYDLFCKSDIETTHLRLWAIDDGKRKFWNFYLKSFQIYYSKKRMIAKNLCVYWKTATREIKTSYMGGFYDSNET